MELVALARDQIASARNYTVKLLEGIDVADWFRMPADGITHIAWQVGHLAMAEYRLCLWQVRGKRDGRVSHFFTIIAREHGAKCSIFSSENTA